MAVLVVVVVAVVVVVDILVICGNHNHDSGHFISAPFCCPLLSTLRLRWERRRLLALEPTVSAARPPVLGLGCSGFAKRSSWVFSGVAIIIRVLIFET